MTYDEHDKQDLDIDIDPAMILLGIGYVTILCMAVGWAATWIT